MTNPTKLIKLDPSDFTYLDPSDSCWHFGEYTSGGGFKASETNQQIYNLKKKPSMPDQQLYWKRKAIEYWGRMFFSTSSLSAAKCEESVTFVPFPCSKPSGHPDFDDRILKVIERASRNHPNMDIRPLILQTAERNAQHTSSRLTPREIADQLELDQGLLARPLKKHVIVVDDVITRGASFAASKAILQEHFGDELLIYGIFLAKTVHPPIDWDDEL